MPGSVGQLWYSTQGCSVQLLLEVWERHSNARALLAAEQSELLTRCSQLEYKLLTAPHVCCTRPRLLGCLPASWHIP